MQHEPTYQILVVDDDPQMQFFLKEALERQQYRVTVKATAEAALTALKASAFDLILIDVRLPGMSGLEVLRALRRGGRAVPVIFLTALSEDIYEEAALEGGAVDFIDKSRRLSILLRRLRLITEGTRPVPEAGPATQQGDVMRIDGLELRFDINRATWKETAVDLTLTEFKIVALMAMRAGEDVSYREIYDLVHGKDFIAGYGTEGFRANVRTFIKRIRKKFRDVDPEFEHIDNYAGFGYRWTAGA